MSDNRFDIKFDKDRALQILRDHNVVKCVMEYSGGNDEGGVDSVSVVYADGTEETNPGWCQRHYTDHIFDQSTGKWTQSALSPEAQKCNAAADMLEAPVYNRYYSFAGEFYAQGEIVYDVTAGTAVMDGSEEVPSSDSVHAEF